MQEVLAAEGISLPKAGGTFPTVDAEVLDEALILLAWSARVLD